MWKYEKRLQYPVKIKQSNPQMAQFIMSQYGGCLLYTSDAADEL